MRIKLKFKKLRPITDSDMNKVAICVRAHSTGGNKKEEESSMRINVGTKAKIIGINGVHPYSGYSASSKHVQEWGEWVVFGDLHTRPKNAWMVYDED